LPLLFPNLPVQANGIGRLQYIYSTTAIKPPQVVLESQPGFNPKVDRSKLLDQPMKIAKAKEEKYPHLPQAS
jgi:hypothetical protein